MKSFPTAPESNRALASRKELPRPYVSAEQLARLTPWSSDAIEKMIARGVLVRGVHFFQLGGRRGRLIFKWEAIVELIEGRRERTRPNDVVEAEGHPKATAKQVLNVQAATTELQRLLR
jgi:hypothetical protein